MNENRPQSLVYNSFRVLMTAVFIGYLSACVSTVKPVVNTDSNESYKESSKGGESSTDRESTPDLICISPTRYKGQVVGNGECVSLIKQCSGAPATAYWRPGQPVLHSRLPTGTVIATFKNDRYPNKTGHHAAIYIEQDDQGIWVWDQWRGKPVHKRLIRIRNDKASPANTAQAYRVVRLK